MEIRKSEVNQTLLVGLTRDEINAVLHQLHTTWVEPDKQALILSAVGKLKRAEAMQNGRPKT